MCGVHVLHSAADHVCNLQITKLKVFFSFRSYFFYQSVVFFSHNKSANNNFSLDFLDQRTDPNKNTEQVRKQICNL